ncbi:MAG: DUF87 domain-containing protein [Ruminococcus sp.]|nr:DUF87 domain-containing protein [Ruminococcus sp.]
MKRKRFKEYKKCTEPVYLTPTSVQETIPVYKISQSGIFQIENQGKGKMSRYDKVYLFQDINYNLKDEEERTEDLEKWIEILQSMQVSFKIIVANIHKDKDLVRAENKLTPLPEYDKPIYSITSKSLNRLIEERQEIGNYEIEQKKYFLISSNKENYEEAKLSFNHLENTLRPFFDALGSCLTALDGIERLKLFHDIYRPGREREFRATWEDLKLGRDWRSEICPMVMKEYPGYLQFDHFQGCVLFAKHYPDSISDAFLSRLTTSLTFPIVTTMDLSPIPKEITKKRLLSALLNTEGAIDRQQQQNNKRGAFNTDPSWDRREEKKRLNEDLEEVERNDQKMFYTSLLIFVMGKDEQELASRVERIKQAGWTEDIQFEEYWNQQLGAFNTVLPTASRFVNDMRPLFTNSLAAFCPFNVCDIRMSGRESHFYGSNYLSKHLIRADKKKLKNGNCFVYAPSGSGKSMFVKDEIVQVLNYTKDDILILDPSNEYTDISDLYEGQFINFTTATETHINPLFIPEEVFEDKAKRLGFVSSKGEFMQLLFRYVKRAELEGNELAIVDRCARNLYEGCFAIYDMTGEMQEPTFREYQEVMVQTENTENEQVQKLVDSMDLYVNGSLNIFSHKSNVDINNRMVVFGIRDLGESLRKPAMMIILEIMTSRLTYNSRNHKATRVYGDELHVVFDDDEFVKALDKLWKVARKDGGLATGITQNISDSTMVESARKMVANSEALVLLSLSKTDRRDLPEIVDISGAEMEYLKNKPQGVGLFKFGETRVIFDKQIPRDNLLYWIYTTDPKDKVEKARVLRRLKEQIREVEEQKLIEEIEEAEERTEVADQVIEQIDRLLSEVEEDKRELIANHVIKKMKPSQTIEGLKE